MRLLFVLFLVFSFGSLVAAQEPTEEPTSEVTPEATPEITATPAPNLLVYSTVMPPGAEEGQPVAVLYQVSAGEGIIAVLLFAILAFNVISVLSGIWESKWLR